MRDSALDSLPSAPTDWFDVARRFHRAALAVARPTSASLFDDLLDELTTGLEAEIAVVGTIEDGSSQWKWVAARRVGEPYHLVVRPLTPALRQLTVAGEPRWVAGDAITLLSPYDDVIEGVATCPLHDAQGRVIGLLAVGRRGPRPAAELMQALMSIFSARLAAEIERQRADEALRHSEASYRAIFEASEDSIVIHDWETGRAIDLNPKACSSTGYTREELLDSMPARLATAGAPHAAEDASRYLELARSGASPRFEWQRRNKDGSVHWGEVQLKAAAIGGKPHILAFRRDITEQKRMLEELRLREEQYRVIFEAASDAFVLRDGALRTVDANPAFYRMYGFDPKLIAAGGGYPTSFPRDYVAERDAQIQRALQGQETHVETKALRADGSAFWIDLRVIPVQYRGQPHVLQVIRDITGLRERERSLQLSEARLRATVEAAFDCVIGMDAEGNIIEFNAAAEACFGYARTAVLGRQLAEVIVPPHHRTAHQDGLTRYLREGSGPFIGRLMETTAMRSDGSEFPVELAISVGEAADHRIFVGHLRDITARRESEAAREALEAQLRHSQKLEALGQLTGGIAHDFNNILTSVLGYIVMAAERVQPLNQPRLSNPLEQAHLAALRARELVSQMLTFARRGPRGSSPRHALRLAPALQRSLNLLRSTLPSGVRIDTRFNGDVPAVVVDEVQLEQVLFNLCINARDAMKGQGVLAVALRPVRRSAVCASCRERLHGPWVEMSVADDGPGISPEVRERMFDPFYTTKEIGQGTGMGLAMVHGIVHDHGGHILVENTETGGSRFSVLLPPSDEIPPETAAGSSLAPQAAPQLRGRVLLVDDDAMVGRYMSDVLGEWGLQVSWIADPQEAQRHFEAAPDTFDLVITDQTMPHLSGSELARRLLAHRPEMPVLLYTGYGDQLDEPSLMRDGVRGVLHKPVDRTALLAALQQHLPE